MSYNPNSIVTISREDDKLVVVRKPVWPTRYQHFSGCFWPVLIFVVFAVFCMYMSFDHIFRTKGADEAWAEARAFLVMVAVATTILFLAFTTLVIRDTLRPKRVVPPPNYYDETISFDTDKIVVQYQGMVSSFSYHLDVKPVLRHCSYPIETLDLIIPCLPLDDHVPSDYHLGGYVMSYIGITDAERILAALKEYLEIAKTRGTG